MGSQSDLPIMQEAIDFLKEMQIPVLVDIVSAHRTPEKLISFGKNAHLQGIDVIIAGAGGAAHLLSYKCQQVFLWQLLLLMGLKMRVSSLPKSWGLPTKKCKSISCNTKNP